MEKIQSLLVTGGAGFIGSNFIRLALKLEPDLKIINLDKLVEAGSESNLADLAGHPNYRFIKGDIADRSLVKQLFQTERPEAVINFAAATHVDKSIHDELDVFLQTNVIGVAVLLEAAKNFPVKKFIQISTDEVYGSLGKTEDRQFIETDRLEPNNPYSATKAAAEALTRAFWQTWGIPAVITRSSNNFGPYQYPEKLIPFAILRLLAGKKIPLYGDGTNVRDWLYVEDNCEAIWRCLQQGQPGEIYNIGGNSEKTNLEIAEAIARHFGQDPKQSIQFVTDRPGHDGRYGLSVAKIGRDLDWQPPANFAQRLTETLNWYQKNEPWLKTKQEMASQINAHLEA